MRRKTAVILGVSGAALALTASSAFTAAGLNVATSGTGFIGGTQTVTVNGTTVSSIQYKADSTAPTKTGSIILTFSDHNANTKVPDLDINFTSAATSASRSAPTDWTCTAIADDTSVTSNSISKCGTDAGVSGAAGTAFLTADLASIALTVE